MALSSPNYTQTPNEVFALMPVMEHAELRVTLVIVRATFGWQQGGSAVVLSLAELQAQSGLSKQGVLNGLRDGQARGTIYKLKAQGAGASAYGLVVHSVDQSAVSGSQLSRPPVVNPVDTRSPSSTLQGVHSVDSSSPLSGQEGVHSVDRGSQPSGLEVVNSVDRGCPLSRQEAVHSVDNLTPLAAVPSAEKTDPERKERKQRKKEKENNTQKGAADAAVCVPEIGTAGELEEQPRNGEGLPTPLQVLPLAGQAGAAGATGPEDVPPAAPPPAAALPLPGPRQPSAALARLMTAWNEHRGPLPRVDTATDGRELGAKKLLKDFGSLDAAVAAVEDATRQAASDDWWLERKYPFDTLVPAKVARRAEVWRARQQPSAPLPPGTPPPTDEPFDLDAALRGASLNGTTRRNP